MQQLHNVTGMGLQRRENFSIVPNFWVFIIVLCFPFSQVETKMKVTRPVTKPGNNFKLFLMKKREEKEIKHSLFGLFYPAILSLSVWQRKGLWLKSIL